MGIRARKEGNVLVFGGQGEPEWNWRLPACEEGRVIKVCSKPYGKGNGSEVFFLNKVKLQDGDIFGKIGK